MLLTEIRFDEFSSSPLTSFPASFGIPLPKGIVKDPSQLALLQRDGLVLPVEMTGSARWSDGSLQWVFCDALLQTNLEQLQLQLVKIDKKKEPDWPELQYWEDSECYRVVTGVSEFVIGKQDFGPFAEVTYAGVIRVSNSLSGLLLTDERGDCWGARVDSWSVIADNRLRLVFKAEGGFEKNDQRYPVRFTALLTFYAGLDRADIEICLLNPQAAKHTGNLWDLGDVGSVLFQRCQLTFPLADNPQHDVVLYPDINESACRMTGALRLYQAGSGGDNWQSPNHVNAAGVTTPDYRGYKVFSEKKEIASGNRATPILATSLVGCCVGLSMCNFWQNFPKAVGSEQQRLFIDLFPKQAAGPFELQGGEQKTHQLSLQVANKESQLVAGLQQIQNDALPIFTNDWYLKCFAETALPPAVPAGFIDEGQEELRELYRCYRAQVDVAIDGENSFFQRRELIDEYGWRNFGELYADHEAVLHQSEQLFISHYNNQYDVIKGALLQFFSTGRSEWFRLAKDLADHVVDIDIYHTDKDRYQYNHGMFWHTDHHLPAATATHRAFSRTHADANRVAGGGPAPDHNYVTGLMLLHRLTGQERYSSAALELAENILQLAKGPDSVAEHGFQLAKRMLGRFKKEPNVGDPAYAHVYGLLDGPGRASGNGLNTLIDGYLLSGNNEFLECAEFIIRSCVSPDDDIEKRGLKNAELRWMYTIFLKALSRYLALKKEREKIGPSFVYARASFLHYAEWMLQNEYPYLDTPDILEFPNETWAAQEFRKCDILAVAGSLTHESLRQQYMEKGFSLFRRGIEQLQSYPGNDLTRPVVLLMTNGMEFIELYSRWQNAQLASIGETANNDRSCLQVDSSSGVTFRPRTLWRVISDFSLKNELSWLKNRFG